MALIFPQVPIIFTLSMTNCACTRFLSKDLVRKPLFPVTLTKG